MSKIEKFQKSTSPLLLDTHENTFILSLSLSNSHIKNYAWLPGILKEMYVEKVKREVGGSANWKAHKWQKIGRTESSFTLWL